jgi:hypothetical protein
METEALELSSDCAEMTRSAQMARHVKENNIAYLIGIFICYNMGILDKVFAYGAGIC